MEFTPEKLAELKKAYSKAKEKGQNSFVFDDVELLVDYAKYLIQYLEMQFEAQTITLN